MGLRNVLRLCFLLWDGDSKIGSVHLTKTTLGNGCASLSDAARLLVLLALWPAGADQDGGVVPAGVRCRRGVRVWLTC